MEIDEKMKQAYHKMMKASLKYDVEYPTPYGKKVMRETYDKLDKLCKEKGLNTLNVCSKLVDTKIFI